jgi:hypothetical protein
MKLFLDHPQDFADGLSQGLRTSPSGEGLSHRIKKSDAFLTIGGKHSIANTR